MGIAEAREQGRLVEIVIICFKIKEECYLFLSSGF